MSESPDPLTDERGALLSALLDQTHDCINLLDHGGRILFLNRRSAGLMELSAPADLIGQYWMERWPESERPELEKAFREGVCGGAPG